VVTLAVVLSAAASAQAKRQAVDPGAELQTVQLSALPAQAGATHRLVLAGGPFPYPKDGVVFGNRERVLPRATRGFYREYTVSTPGERHRGARRIVCGGPVTTKPEACYYTGDHYTTFQRIVP
jgi:ribonuclease T1